MRRRGRYFAKAGFNARDVMLDLIKNKLKAAVNFPSPPAVAQQILALASDPDVDVARVAAAIGHDPGLAAKVLRVANSPLYAKRRKSENLRQALVVLGLNGATTLALSFSLVGAYKRGKSAGIDHSRYWRRTILSATAARVFAVLQPTSNVEGIFLAALLQEIGVLAIDRVQLDFYRDVPAAATHAQIVAHEQSRLGTDHAGVGAWLLDYWRLPEFLCRTVELSHAPALEDRASSLGQAARCVALGSECAEILLAHETPDELHALTAHAGEWLDIGPEVLAEAMGQIVAEIPEIERLFDTELVSADSAAAILDQARELLMNRNLQAFEQVAALRETTESLAARTVELEDHSRRDALTGLYNRGHLDQVLEQEFRSANAGHGPLSVVFVDLDRFKRVNDTYGHGAGDVVLVATAKLLRSAARDTDCIARYGGEEFVIVLPGLTTEAAARVCERLLDRLRAARHDVAGASFMVTASLGLATHAPESPFQSVAQLIEAADRSVYTAKKRGRDQLVRHVPDRMARAG
jgi:diguanylate cyclase (GGDEF)-like protein